jgi:hypothetical protein
MAAMDIEQIFTLQFDLHRLAASNSLRHAEARIKPSFGIRDRIRRSGFEVWEAIMAQKINGVDCTHVLA